MPAFRSRPSRGASIIAVVVGIGMLIFAISAMGNSDLGGGGLGGGFIALWVLALVAVIGYHVFNAATGKGYTESIDYDEPFSSRDTDSNSLIHPQSSDESVADRLRELDSLKEQGLVNEQEYIKERQRILGSL